jgi:hypothetical protein
MTTPSSIPSTNQQQEAPVNIPAVEVLDEVRPPAYRVAPRLSRRLGYAWAPVVVGAVGAVSWLVQVVSR